MHGHGQSNSNIGQQQGRAKESGIGRDGIGLVFVYVGLQFMRVVLSLTTREQHSKYECVGIVDLLHGN